MSNAMPASREPLALYAIGLGSNRRHARHGDPRAVLLAALAALESDDIEAVDASPIIASDPLGPSRRRYANAVALVARSEEHTSELQSLMRHSYAVFCLKKKIKLHKLYCIDDTKND